MRSRDPKGTSSTGRASVSKTEGWGFKSLVPCKDEHWTTVEQGRGEDVTDSSAVRRDAQAPRSAPALPRSTARSSPSSARSSGRPRSSWSPTSSWCMVFVLFFMALVSLLDLGFGKLVFEVFTGADGQ